MHSKFNSSLGAVWTLVISLITWGVEKTQILGRRKKIETGLLCRYRVASSLESYVQVLFVLSRGIVLDFWQFEKSKFFGFEVRSPSSSLWYLHSIYSKICSFLLFFSDPWKIDILLFWHSVFPWPFIKYLCGLFWIKEGFFLRIILICLYHIFYSLFCRLFGVP